MFICEPEQTLTQSLLLSACWFFLLIQKQTRLTQYRRNVLPAAASVAAAAVDMSRMVNSRPWILKMKKRWKCVHENEKISLFLHFPLDVSWSMQATNRSMHAESRGFTFLQGGKPQFAEAFSDWPSCFTVNDLIKKSNYLFSFNCVFPHCLRSAT